MPDLSDEIQQAATEPASAAGDGQTAASHPLPDLVDVDRYLKGGAALAGANRKGGRRSAANLLRTGVYVPRGAV